jgi:1-acyl-sn-glycerol-3-phosphate acyltransferase
MVVSFMILSSLIMRVLLAPFSPHVFVRHNTRWIIYPASQLLMRVIGVRMRVIGEISKSQQLVVSHHQGVIDSLMLMALSPCMVISNTDIRSVKGVGWVMEQLGFVFVNRSRRRSIHEVLKPTVDMIGKSKINVGFFPEGRSNNGLDILPFHSSFFQIASAPGAEITPLSFQYVKANGKPVAKDDLSFFAYQVAEGSVVNYVYNMLRVRSVEIEVRILQKIENIQIEQEQMSRKDLCVLAEKRIEAEFKKRLIPLES